MDDDQKRLRRLEQKLGLCMARDRHSLRQGLNHIRKQHSPDCETVKGSFASLEKRFALSMRTRALRRESLPPLRFNEDLPICLRKDEIIQSIRENQVLVLSGETGSGKTTQIPKFCLAAGRGLSGMIACTQPRRIAALTVSARIAEELGQEAGLAVGYQIRFLEKTSEKTLVKVMTDGVLLAEIQTDRYLTAYDTIIVDEAHERSLNIDFILGILSDLLKKRKDLKVIITSATIDTEKFSKAFGGAKVIEVTGRTFPVDVIYRPLLEADEEDPYVDRAVSVVEEIHRLGPFGDILIFMPTEADIRECCELLNARTVLSATVMPLFARMSAADQKKIFEPSTGRKIVVATNVAETSITIPGIRYVVDTGLARIPRYTPRTRTTSLPVTAISKSSADQRKGRSGRVENGICYRLYSEKEYEDRPLFTAPHILRANLAEVILRMIALSLGDVNAFPFIDPPSQKSIKDGFDTLIELGAIRLNPGSGKKKGPSYGLTDKGRIMARIPLDPTLSRMLIEAASRGCLSDVTIIIAALSIRDPRDRPLDKAQQADQAHAVFKDPQSDFITLLNIWNAFNQELAKGGRRLALMRQFCKTRYLSFLRMREWQDIHGQLKDILKEQGLADQVRSLEPNAGKKNSPFKPLYTSIHQSILAGYLSGIAVKKEKNMYTATRGREAMIFPGSGLFNNGGPWIVAAEMVETSRLFARTVACIDCAWLEELGGASLVYTHSNPRWDRKKGAVIAHEQVSLFGLVIAERAVLFGKVNPEEATKIFIQSALVDGDVELDKAGKELAFIRHNLALVEEVRALEDRVRRRDILVPEDVLAEFYDQRIQGISDIRTLARTVKERGGCAFLNMNKDMLLRYSPDEKEFDRFPEKITLGQAAFSVNYRFEPGKDHDGITVNIPSASVGAVRPEALDWLVPGLVREKIEGLIKNLPKEYRKQLVPVSTTLSIIEGEMPELIEARANGLSPETGLETALSRFIHKRFNIHIPVSAWSPENLSPHLSMRIAVTGPKGDILVTGRDKGILDRDFSKTAEDDGFEQERLRYERPEISFDAMETLPDSIPLVSGGKEKGLAFPCFKVEEGRVALRLFRQKKQADHYHVDGVKALFERRLSDHLKSLKKDLVLKGQHRNYANYFGGEKSFNRNMAERVISELFALNLRTRKDFEAHAESTGPGIYNFGQTFYSLATAILDAYHETRSLIYSREIKGLTGGFPEALALELRQELAHLVPESFLSLYSLDRLTHLGRFIKGIRIRAQRAFENPDKDKIKAGEIKPFNDMLSGFVNDLKPVHSDERRNRIEDFFWLIEEFKISVFAQELKTPVKISPKRLNALADEIRRMI